MKIKFIRSNELEKPFRLAVHRSGKLGFTTEAAIALGLTVEKSAFLGVNEDDSTDKALYMLLNDGVEEGAFKVSKAGNYYYLPIKLLLDSLEIPYQSESVAFSMDKIEIGGVLYYRLRKVESAKIKKLDTAQEGDEEGDDLI